MDANNIYRKLMLIQQELKAPKDKNNKFGNYTYRSAESILESVKPILVRNDVTLILVDDIVLIGDRYYVKATARLFDNECAEGVISATAFAREDANQKGKDVSQITGTASSYARKYALNGLFCIDDTKDTDTNEFHVEKTNRAKAQEQEKAQEPEPDHSQELCSGDELKAIENIWKRCSKDPISDYFHRWPEVTKAEYTMFFNELKAKKAEQDKAK